MFYIIIFYKCQLKITMKCTKLQYCCLFTQAKLENVIKYVKCVFTVYVKSLREFTK